MTASRTDEAAVQAAAEAICDGGDHDRCERLARAAVAAARPHIAAQIREQIAHTLETETVNNYLPGPCSCGQVDARRVLDQAAAVARQTGGGDR